MGHDIRRRAEEKMTFREAKTYFLRDTRNESTRQNRRDALKQFVTFCREREPKFNPAEAPYGVVRELLKEWVWRDSAFCKESTLLLKLSCISSFYNWLILEGQRDDNPATKIPVGIQDNPSEPKYPSSELADAFIECLSKRSGLRGIRNLIAVRMLREAGLRIAELVALKVSDLNLETGVVLVRKGKNNKMRRTAVTVSLCEIISNFVEEAGLLETDFLFPRIFKFKMGVDRRKDRLHLNVQTVRLVLLDEARAFGFDEDEVQRLRKPHNFRHLWATEHVAAGTPVALLTAMGGWNDTKMVMYYVNKAGLTPVAVGG